MKKIFAIIIIALSVLAAQAQGEPAMKITAAADSTTLIMGDRTGVTVEVIKNGHNGDLLTMPQKEADYYGLEMSDVTIDSVDLGNNRIQLRYNFTFQAFDPAEIITLPPFVYVAAGDTLRSDILTFKVLPVELDPALGDLSEPENLTIHPDEGIQSIPSKWYDIIPDWIGWVIAAIALIAAAVILWALYKKNGPRIFTRRKPLPPYERAIRDLNLLKRDKLIEAGRSKEFYTGVTDIWRTYLDGRFGIPAMEMTSSQILEQIRKNSETSKATAEIEDILRLSDFVKFAALDASEDEMLRAYNTIYRFVEDTRPLPEEQEGGNDTSKSRDNKKDKNKK